MSIKVKYFNRYNVFLWYVCTIKIANPHTHSYKIAIEESELNAKKLKNHSFRKMYLVHVN